MGFFNHYPHRPPHPQNNTNPVFSVVELLIIPVSCKSLRGVGRGNSVRVEGQAPREMGIFTVRNYAGLNVCPEKDVHLLTPHILVNLKNFRNPLVG